ncbi:MAG: ATP-dependent Clp protease proteolytic subunit [Opitutae bacterium]
MTRLALIFTLFVTALQAQSRRIEKTPETIQTEVEAEIIRTRLDLAESQRRQAKQASDLEVKKLEVENRIRQLKSDAAGAMDDAEKSQLNLKTSIANVKASLASGEKDARRAEFEADVKLASAQAAVEYARLEKVGEIARLQKKVIETTSGKIEYPLDPLAEGVLRISDRRIPFNGIVDETLAKFVCDRIAFYNALDKKAPIFIVIDRSPGGSVMSGYQILQAMESSQAPVYVVVKGYAASMAAIITTMAKQSYVYPQTVVLHHQASTSLSGNQTQLEQQLKWSKIWCERIFVKVANKMGITVDEFVAKMYAAVSTGDWKVLGTEAVKLKWVTHVVDRMTEEGVNNTAAAPALGEIKPDGLNGTTALSPLTPFDVWWIYDPSTEFIYR